jgi:hypothetical protein
MSEFLFHFDPLLTLALQTQAHTCRPSHAQSTPFAKNPKSPLLQAERPQDPIEDFEKRLVCLHRGFKFIQSFPYLSMEYSNDPDRQAGKSELKGHALVLHQL